MRRNQFKVDAESVQGNAGAWVECKAIPLGEYQTWIADSGKGNLELLQEYLIDWGGLEDSDGHEMPSYKAEPDAIKLLYLHEINAIAALVIRGPIDSKN
jgi:hypothetical protein